MKQYQFLDDCGTFRMEQPENLSYLYFPIAGEQGIKGVLTPNLGGDSKIGQNQFILQPVSAEELHNNKSTRNFWVGLSDEAMWSATGASAESQSKKFTKEQEESVLEAGMMWHKISRKSAQYGLSSEVLSFVPVSSHNVEIMKVTIKNEGSEAKTIQPVAAIPLYGRSADNIRDHKHVTSLLHRILTTESGVMVTPTLSFDERGHQVNDTTYFVNGAEGNGAKPVGFYPVVEKFIGEGGSFERPLAVLKNYETVQTGVQIDGYEAIGAIRYADTTLAAGESKNYIVVIGMELDNDMQRAAKKTEEILAEFNTVEKVDSAWEHVKDYWGQKLNVAYQTGDKDFDNFMYWVNFQPMLRRIYGCSFLPHHDYGKGGRGWRDLWQDCLALLIMNPDGVREMLFDNYGGVRMDGSNATIIGSKQGEFIADRNNITRVWMDHGVWPLMTTKFYIDQTGDLGILLKENTYFKDKQVVRGTKTDVDFKEGSEPILLDKQGRKYYGTILEHILVQNLTVFYEVGEHNHMRLRGADWNDALDMAEKRGESVAFSAAYAGNLETLAELLAQLKEKKQMETVEVLKEMEVLFKDDVALYDDVEAKKALLNDYCESCIHDVSGERCGIPVDAAIASLHNKAEWLKEHIRKTEWVNDEAKNAGWFNSYYDNSGRAVEGIREDGVRMMLTGQVFTVMSGTATDAQVADIAKSADEYLYLKEVGGYRLNTNFREMKTDLGRMFGFAYGHKENGAVFSHMTTMYANALYKRGFAKEGFKALNTLYEQAVNIEVSKIYPGIPEYFSDNGRGMYHYLTGAASWLMLTVITEMFGVKGKYGDLCLEPKLMPQQFDENGKAAVSLTFGKRKWKVIFINEDKKSYGEYKIANLFLDGDKLEVSEDGVVVKADKIAQLSETMVHEIIAELK